MFRVGWYKEKDVGIEKIPQISDRVLMEEQRGFRKDRTTTDSVFTLKQIYE